MTEVGNELERLSFMMSKGRRGGLALPIPRPFPMVSAHLRLALNLHLGLVRWPAPTDTWENCA
jgi:hypothetical protein